MEGWPHLRHLTLVEILTESHQHQRQIGVVERDPSRPCSECTHLLGSSLLHGFARSLCLRFLRLRAYHAAISDVCAQDHGPSQVQTAWVKVMHNSNSQLSFEVSQVSLKVEEGTETSSSREAAGSGSSNFPQPRHARNGPFASKSSRGRDRLCFSNEELQISSLCREGHLDKALGMLSSVKSALPTSVYVLILKLCSKKKALNQALQVHIHLVQNNVPITGFIGDYLVMSLAKCGAVEEACQISASLPHRTVFSWTAILSAKADSGHGQEALEMFQYMQKEGIEPNNYTFVSLFKACGIVQNLSKGKELHEFAFRRGFSSDSFVRSALVSFYSKCGSIVAAEDVFSSLLQTDIVSWNAMLAAYVEHGAGAKGLKLYRQLHQEGVRPDQLTFVLVLQACGALAEKGETLCIEGGSARAVILDIGGAIRSDFQRNAPSLFASNALVSVYGKCGAILEAEHVFGALSHRSIVSWNSMLAAYLQEVEYEKVLLLYRQMQQEGIGPSERTLVFAIQACGFLAETEESLIVNGQPIKVVASHIGEALYMDARKLKFDSDTVVGTALLSMYGKCGSVMKAEAVFVALSYRDKIAWNAMLSLYVEQNYGFKALKLYRQMHEEGLFANEVGLMLAYQACGILLDKERILVEEIKITRVESLEICESLHADARKKGFGLDVYLGSSLISMYAKLGAVRNAENVFIKLPCHDVVLWTTMIAAYVEQDKGEMALQLFQQMLREGVNMDSHALVHAVQACASLAEKERATAMQESHTKLMAIEIGRVLHREARSKGFTSNLHVGIALVSMYGKFGAFDEAEDVFGVMSQANIVLWNAMFSAYLEHGHYQKVIWLYTKIRNQGLVLDDVTLVCILQACRLAGSLQVCSELHFSSASMGWDQVWSFASALIHAYGNCASLQDANALFHELARPDLVSFNACCDGYTAIGNFLGSLYMFENVELGGAEPDDVTFLSVLTVCSHTGCIHEGLEYFDCMRRDYGIVSSMKHYGILLDLLGRAGDFKRIEDILRTIPMLVSFPMWLSLLGSCSTHGNIELARQAFEHAVKLQPKDGTAYILMSNIYIDAGLHSNAAEVESFRQHCGASEAWLGHNQI